jgi:hypothetical protein
MLVGAFVEWLAQSYVVLSFVVLVLSTAQYATNPDIGLWPLLAWPLALFVALSPSLYGIRIVAARKRSREEPEGYWQAAFQEIGDVVWATSAPTVLAGFLLFAFLPRLSRPLWAWVPLSTLLVSE